jgi:hypothetical protein
MASSRRTYEDNGHDRQTNVWICCFFGFGRQCHRPAVGSGLVEGLGDIAVGNLTVTEERLETVDFASPEHGLIVNEGKVVSNEGGRKRRPLFQGNAL